MSILGAAAIGNAIAQAAGWFFNGDTSLLKAETRSMPDMYTIWLHNSTIDIRANMPQNFSIQLASTWDDSYCKTGTEDKGGTVNSKSSNHPWQSQNGTSTTIYELSQLQWQAGAHLEFTIPFALRATYSAKEEVVDKMRILLEAVAPHMEGAMMVNPVNLDDPLILEIGTFLKLSPVIVESVSEEFDSIFDKQGYPISVIINVNVKSLYTMTDETIKEMFQDL